MSEEVIIFDRHENGSVTVRSFPKNISITPELLGLPDTGSRLIRTFIEFNAANGRAVRIAVIG